jgi:hypothetical protein
MFGAEPGGFGGKPGIGLEGFDAANGCCGPRTPGRAPDAVEKGAGCGNKSPLGHWVIFSSPLVYIYTIIYIYIYCNICIKNKWRFISQTFFPDLEVSCDEQCNQSQALRELQQACSAAVSEALLKSEARPEHPAAWRWRSVHSPNDLHTCSFSYRF